MGLSYFIEMEAKLVIINGILIIICVLFTSCKQKTPEVDCGFVYFDEYQGEKASPPSNMEDMRTGCNYILELKISKINNDTDTFSKTYKEFDFNGHVCKFVSASVLQPPKERLGWSIGCTFNCCEEKK